MNADFNSKSKLETINNCATRVVYIFRFLCKLQSEKNDTQIDIIFCCGGLQLMKIQFARWLFFINRNIFQAANNVSNFSLKWMKQVTRTRVNILSPMVVWRLQPRILSALINWNFHQLEVVSRWRDPQLQVGENCSDLKKIEVNDFESLLIDVTFYL